MLSVDDVSQVRLIVKVEFRANEGLVQLSSVYHSGGERALSTMLILLAMQSVTPLPFRVLDEINQVRAVGVLLHMRESSVNACESLSAALASQPTLCVDELG